MNSEKLLKRKFEFSSIIKSPDATLLMSPISKKVRDYHKNRPLNSTVMKKLNNLNDLNQTVDTENDEVSEVRNKEDTLQPICDNSTTKSDKEPLAANFGLLPVDIENTETSKLKPEETSKIVQ